MREIRWTIELRGDGHNDSPISYRVQRPGCLTIYDIKDEDAAEAMCDILNELERLRGQMAAL